MPSSTQAPMASLDSDVYTQHCTLIQLKPNQLDSTDQRNFVHTGSGRPKTAGKDHLGLVDDKPPPVQTAELRRSASKPEVLRVDADDSLDEGKSVLASLGVLDAATLGKQHGLTSSSSSRQAVVTGSLDDDSYEEDNEEFDREDHSKAKSQPVTSVNNAGARSSAASTFPARITTTGSSGQQSPQKKGRDAGGGVEDGGAEVKKRQKENELEISRLESERKKAIEEHEAEMKRLSERHRDEKARLERERETELAELSRLAADAKGKRAAAVAEVEADLAVTRNEHATRLKDQQRKHDAEMAGESSQGIH